MLRATCLALALLFSIVVGYSIGAGEDMWLALVAAIAVVAVVATIAQRRAWVLMPLTWSLSGAIPILGLPFSPRHLSIILVTCAYVGYRVLSRSDVRQRVIWLDTMVWLNLGWFLFTYILHPVGFRVFGTSTIGGRPYIEAAFAAVAYWLLVHLPDSEKAVSRIPYFMLASALVVTAFMVIGYVFPAVVPRLYMFYAGLDVDVYLFGSNRLKGLNVIGTGIVLLVCAYYRPGTWVNPVRLRFYFLLLGLGCILISGFRSRFLSAIAMALIAALFQRGWRELIVASLLSGLLLAALIAGQGKFYDLPPSVQRTLSFLPGNWSPTAVEEAEQSTRWRLELWQVVISEKAIKNWWLGDGTGFAVEESDAVHSGEQAFTESVLATGYYHNGPLTAIRYAGIVGLVLFYPLMIVAAVYAARCVQRCRGTPLFPVSIYVAVQLIWYPLFFTFVFGSYGIDVCEIVFLAALLRLLIRMVESRSVTSTDSLRTTAAVAQIPALAKATGS